MAMIVLSSPATLTGSEEKKTGPSRFRPDFSSVTLDPTVQKPEWLVYRTQTGSLHGVHTQFTPKYTQRTDGAHSAPASFLLAGVAFPPVAGNGIAGAGEPFLIAAEI
jgi:hypothetical protein